MTPQRCHFSYSYWTDIFHLLLLQWISVYTIFAFIKLQINLYSLPFWDQGKNPCLPLIFHHSRFSPSSPRYLKTFVITSLLYMKEKLLSIVNVHAYYVYIDHTTPEYTIADKLLLSFSFWNMLYFFFSDNLSVLPIWTCYGTHWIHLRTMVKAYMPSKFQNILCENM